MKGVPLVLEVRDLWPESLTAVGFGNDRSMLHRGLAKIAKFLYRRADHIVVVSPAFQEKLVSDWHVPAKKISTIHNGVETKLFSPRNGAELRARLKLEDKFVVSYIGTIGLAHGLETIIEAAEKLQSAAPNVVFLIVGEGADRARILAISKNRNLKNLVFEPQQPRESIPAYIAVSDVCLVLLKKSDVFETVIPTKMLEFMSCGRPVILGVKGQARKIVESSRAGICIEPESPEVLCEAIQQLRQQEFLREMLGRNGREFIVQNLSRERTAFDYLELLQNLASIKSTSRVAA